MKPWEQYLRYLKNVLEQDFDVSPEEWRDKGYWATYPKCLLPQEGWNNVVVCILLELRSFGPEAFEEGRAILKAWQARYSAAAE